MAAEEEGQEKRWRGKEREGGLFYLVVSRNEKGQEGGRERREEPDREADGKIIMAMKTYWLLKIYRDL